MENRASGGEGVSQLRVDNPREGETCDPMQIERCLSLYILLEWVATGPDEEFSHLQTLGARQETSPLDVTNHLHRL
jgi:hypothetical protein